MIPDPESLGIESLVSADQRRVTVSAHAEWRTALAAESPRPGFDEIDQAVEQATTDAVGGIQNPEIIDA